MKAKNFSAGRKYRDAIRETAIEDKSDKDKIKLLISYGTLAPSTHNTQPWQFSITGEKLNIYIDFSKSVPVADPLRRDMYVSIGALIKNVQLAAGEFGITTTVKFAKPLHDSDLVATIELDGLEAAKTPKKSQVLDGIVKRQNYRGFFTKSFSTGKFDAILADVLGGQAVVSAQAVTDRNKVEQLAQLTARGLQMGYAMPTFRREISSYVNHNLSRKRHGLHGYSLRMTTPQSLIIPHVMKRKDIGKKLAAVNYKSFIASPLVAVLTTEKDDEASWLNTGQVMEELMVRMSAAGMATSIYTAAIEMKGLRAELIGVLGAKTALPQVLFCVGNPGAPLPYSKRKHLSAIAKTQ